MGDGPALLAYDKRTGALVARLPLPANPYGNPITYLHEAQQYLVIAVGGGPFFTVSDEEIEPLADDFAGLSADELRAAATQPTTPQLLAYRLP